MAPGCPVYLLLTGAFLSGYGAWVPGVTLFGLYLIGLILAPLVAFALKSTLLRGEAPIFVMEMPLYKVPSVRTVCRRAFDGGWMFVRRAGTLILASMVVIWALLYFPAQDAEERDFEERMEQARDDDRDEIQAEWKANSVLGRTGKFIEPAVERLGWDWRIGLSALASFPAREVMVGTLGIVFSEGEGKSDDEAYRERIGSRMKEIFTVPVALSVMV